MLMVLCLSPFTIAQAEGLDPVIQVKVTAQIKEIQTWASDPILVKAVLAHNSARSADESAMTQDKWNALSILDPFVRSLCTNEASQFLKTKKTPEISEVFVNGSDGTKVAFLNKTTNWNHTGKPKHDIPMTGKPWESAVEVDDSTGLQQIQISVPILVGGRSIGSLVVGLSVSRL